MNQAPVIIGAGLAGLIAAQAFPQAMIYEASEGPKADHRALLRFRTDGVAKLTGIEFREVTVRKGIWFDGKFIPPDIGVANAYALKCLDRLAGDRSIWNLDSASRFIAPESLYEQLLEAAQGRVTFGFTEAFWLTGPKISTAPLSVAAKSMYLQHDLEFARASIHVERFRIPKADVFQTVYFPSHNTPVYRASITGDLLIIESRGAFDTQELNEVFDAFAIGGNGEVQALDARDQAYGKIAPVDEAKRKALIFELSQKHNIFSLGRFATWRNILLDDVVNDIAVIKRLLRADLYGRAHSMS